MGSICYVSILNTKKLMDIETAVMDSNKITNNANREVPLDEVRVSYQILSPLSWQNFPTPKKKNKNILIV